MAKKITREELERDELAETLQSLAEWLKRNQYKMLIAAGLAVILVAASMGWGSYRQRVSEESSRILKLANQALVEIYNMPDDAKRAEGLNGAITQLQTLIERYPDTPAAHTALFLQGNCHFHKDDLAKAQDAYRRFLDASTTNEERAQGEIALAYAIENEIYFTKNEQKAAEAKGHFEKAMELAPPRSHQYYFAMMGLARILELTYQDEQALELYKRILAERPSPIAGAVEIDTDSMSNFGQNLEAYAKRYADQRQSQLSLYATVKLRAERLEASIKAGNAGASAPKTPTLPQDAPTTPALEAAAPMIEMPAPMPAPAEAPMPAASDAPTTPATP